ncbi:HIT-like domain-containing protein [Calycina marina]|uniref:HIT-like domain-containing protein n=1 Tax=Calycina marina TaxID=1763456 RepID=A0A9P8CH06_9HELO|nr:HIT-like domain-containing protein [Calycina marina]
MILTKFQVRFSPTLANKPKSTKFRTPGEKTFDPFENPSEGLLVTEDDDNFIVLNKFPVIPDHFILATKQYKLQTHLLEECDVGAAYQCLAAYRDNGEELFGFFNSGDESGASQPHRHIQFLPVDSMRSGITEPQTWSVLADILAAENPGMYPALLGGVVLIDHKLVMPFKYFASSIDEGFTSLQLYESYLDLHSKACQSAGQQPVKPHADVESPISYNLGLTSRTMILCPRTCEGIKIKSDKNELIGPVSLNGTVLGGTLLVKSKEEWDALKNDNSKLEHVLRSIGITHDGKL